MERLEESLAKLEEVRKEIDELTKVFSYTPLLHYARNHIDQAIADIRNKISIMKGN